MISKGENLTFRFIILFYLNINIVSVKNKTACKETEKYGPFKGKNESIGTIPEKDQTEELQDKDFKTVALKMIKELKKDMEKVKKMMHEPKWNYQ